MNLKDSKIQKIVLIALFIGIVSYLYFGSTLFSFCYKVKRQRIVALENEYGRLSADLEKARRIVGNLARLEAEYEKLHDQWLSAQELLPEEKEMPDLLRKVTTAGNKAGVKFVLFQPAQTVQKEFYTEHPIRVRVRGGYHQLGIFMSRLANLPRIVNVSSLTLDSYSRKQKGKSNNANATVAADFTLTAYTLLGGYENDARD